MTDTGTRDFPLADILSVTTGRLLSRDGLGGVYRILSHLTSDQIMIEPQIPRALDACHLKVLEQHPQLLGVTPHTNAEIEHIDTWLTLQESRFGSLLPVAPIDGWERRNPIVELAERLGPERVIPVVMEP
ncbi:MAG TPA: hypothetical protein VN714_12710 [Trebonia sp.]|nr:hypothetical protein [Trebonia sp.]